ncbi:SDR family NAD(P)-dependent oxidoreductase [Streptomyces hokutonensis]|uniref:SDR family NAD(P)-dependent oxidoreductase n=1 Tax=Streptomyces hokutonensis TaxID=1306990 RepID=A0ABW6M5C9_9ACTN
MPHPQTRAALVTGSTDGIGRTTALPLARAGMFVVVTGRDEKRGEETCQAIRDAEGSAALVLADLLDADAVRDLAEAATVAAGGHIDVLVNNAAVPYYAPTAQTPAEDFDSVMAVNVRAPFLLTGALAPAMARRKHGVIVNITGTAAQLGVPGLSLFGATKAALSSMTRTWATEYGRHGVRVNALDLGAIRTPRADEVAHDVLEAYGAAIPAGRPGEPEEVAEVVAFLASPAAAYIQGAVLPVDGSMLVTSPTAPPPDELPAPGPATR